MRDTISRIVSESSVYCPGGDVEAMRIDWHNDETREFHATGEESDETYVISYDEVDLMYDIFYKLVLVDTQADGSDYC
jgi:hypothetical protein